MARLHLMGAKPDLKLNQCVRRYRHIIYTTNLSIYLHIFAFIICVDLRTPASLWRASSTDWSSLPLRASDLTMHGTSCLNPEYFMFNFVTSAKYGILQFDIGTLSKRVELPKRNWRLHIHTKPNTHTHTCIYIYIIFNQKSITEHM